MITNKSYRLIKVFLCEEVINYFLDKLYIPIINQFPFHISHVIILGLLECGGEVIHIKM